MSVGELSFWEVAYQANGQGESESKIVVWAADEKDAVGRAKELLKKNIKIKTVRRWGSG
jgi:hypothetical protein